MTLLRKLGPDQCHQCGLVMKYHLDCSHRLQMVTCEADVCEWSLLLPFWEENVEEGLDEDFR